MTDKENPSLSIIIVSYNTCQMTLECIRSVFDETKTTKFEIIIVDNASHDNSAEEIEKEFGSKINLIKLSDNVGFAAGNNMAVKYASSDLILLLNPDTIVLDKAIDKLVAFSNQHNDSMIWGGITLYADRSLNPTSCWGKITLWSVFCSASGLSLLFKNNPLFNREQYGGWKRNTVKEVDIVSGCFLLIKSSLWDKLGGFDKDFFMYAEDADLCLRASNLGAKPLVSPDAVIIHYGGASGGIKEETKIKLFKAKILLMKKHWGKYNYKLGRFVYSLYPLNKMIAHKMLSLVNKKFKNESLVWDDIWKRRREWLGF